MLREAAVALTVVLSVAAQANPGVWSIICAGLAVAAFAVVTGLSYAIERPFERAVTPDVADLAAHAEAGYSAEALTQWTATEYAERVLPTNRRAMERVAYRLDLQLRALLAEAAALVGLVVVQLIH